MNTKILLFAVVGAIAFGGNAQAITPGIECEEGYIAEYVLVSEAVAGVPATYKCPKFGSAYKLFPVKDCMIKKGAVKFYADKVIDTPAIPEIPAVYEWQCVVDPNYTEPEEENGEEENGEENGNEEENDSEENGEESNGEENGCEEENNEETITKPIVKESQHSSISCPYHKLPSAKWIERGDR